MTVELGVAELAATRFAVSPLSETVAALQQLAGQHRQALHLRWFRWASDELAARPLDLPRTWPLITGDRPSWPSFVVPAPSGPGHFPTEWVCSAPPTSSVSLLSSGVSGGEAGVWPIPAPARQGRMSCPHRRSVQSS